jgi:hypothetical protein
MRLAGEGALAMRRLAVLLLILPGLAGCATRMHDAALKRSIDAVVLDEGQRDKVVQAAAAGESADQALAHASDGPKNQKPVPN